jgi:hypothetical protein
MEMELSDTQRCDIVEEQLDYIVELCNYHFENKNDSYAGVLYAEYKEWLEEDKEYVVAWAPDFTQLTN